MELHCCFSYITTWIEQGIRAWRKKGRKEGRKERKERKERVLGESEVEVSRYKRSDANRKRRRMHKRGKGK